MDKEFVPYIEALELKEIGFDEPCFGGYYSTQSNVNLWFFKKAKNSDRDERVRDGFATAPTFSQAFRWFREKYALDGSPYPYYTKWGYQVLTLDLTGKYHYYSTTNSRTEFPDNFNTYEEAELACLRKLIEIVKNQIRG